jgi:hypothetical protein
MDPEVERIVHKDVGEKRAYYSLNPKDNTGHSPTHSREAL